MADQTLKRTVDKILDQTEGDILEKIQTSIHQASSTLDDSIATLEQDYDKIIADGHKEADKIQRQLVGSADLEARNKQLRLIEDSIDKVFDKAIEKIQNTDRNDSYSQFIRTLLDESAKILGSTDFTVYTNDKDTTTVESLLSNYAGATLAPDRIDCMGGVKVVSKDGSMTFDDTIDARLDRMKPLIRKEIATKFGLGN